MQVRCPHCHSPIELSGESSLSDIPCPTCGSSFSLIGEDETEAYEPGTKTISHFELVERIGVGTFGVVWKARDIDLDRTVAIKIPRKGRLDPSETEQFLREARAAAQLMHPSIVSVHEVGRHDETVFIVSDFVEGVTLADRISSERFSVREAAEMCVKIADALHHAHEAKVVHRDLKPANVILDPDGEPHIMDFGLARREAGEVTMTIEGRTLGTPAYMSPEQARGSAHTADRRSDVYSLGVILFELLTGERPFRGSLRMLLHHVIHDEAPSPRKLASNVPRDLETICLKCLEKDPDKRYPTCQELADELRTFLAEKAIHARPISKAARGWRWCKRNRAVSCLFAAFISAVLAGLVGVSWQWFRAESEAEAKRRQLYISDMNVARQAWADNNLRLVGDLLERHASVSRSEPDLRGFEWYYLWGLCKRGFVAESLDVGNRALSVVFSLDGKRLAIGKAYGEVTLLDIESNERIELGIKGQRFWNGGLGFSHDGMKLALVADDGYSVRLVHIGQRTDGVPTPRNVDIPMSLGELARIRSLAMSRVGPLMATGHYDGTVAMWNWESKDLICKGKQHEGEVRSVGFSSDGQLLVSGGEDGVVQTWGAKRLDPIRKLPVLKEGSSSTYRGIWSVAFAQKNTVVVSAGVDRAVRLWHWAGDQQVMVLKGHTDEVRSVAVSPDGKLLASASRDNTIRLWDLPSGDFRDELKGHWGIVQSVAFSPNPTRPILASGGHDGRALLWRDLSRTDGNMLSGEHGLGELAFWPRDRILVGATKISFDNENPKWGKYFLLWQLDHPTMPPKRIPASAQVTSIAMSTQGILAVGMEHGDVQLCRMPDATDGMPLPGDCEGRTSALAFSSTGQKLAVGTTQGELIVWANQGRWTMERLNRHSRASINALAWQSDETLCSAKGDGNIELWDTSRAMPPKVLDKRHDEQVLTIAFSSDGKLLASGGTEEFINVWRLPSDRPLYQLKGQSASVRHLLFADDGQTLMSASGDCTVRIWDVEQRTQRFVFPRHSSALLNLSYDPKSRILAAAGRDGSVCLWRAAAKEEVDAVRWRRGAE